MNRATLRASRVVAEALERRMLLSLLPAGAEFRVNTFTTTDQATPAVASDADGDFVVVWQGSGSGDGNGIFAQRYDAAGVAQGAEFRVNTSTIAPQQDPAVAMDSDGDFVVVWESQVAPGNYDIFAQRYNAAGVAQGGEFRTNTFTTSDQLDPSVAMDASGNLLIAWQSLGQEGATNRGIYAQRYNAFGTPLVGEMHVNTVTADNQLRPAAAMDDDGDFIITWFSYGTYGIFAQRYNAAGAAVGGQIQLTGIVNRHAIAMDADGDFVLTWDLPDGSGQGVFARRFNGAGLAQGAEFPVNTFTTGSQQDAAVAMDAHGNFLLTWSSDGQDGSAGGIYAQAYSAAGVAQGGEFRVNTFTTGVQRFPAVAMDADGNSVVAWQSNSQDGSSYGTYAQRYSESNPDTASPMVGGLFIGGEEVAPGQRVENVTSSLILSFSENLSNAVSLSHYRLTRNGLDVSSQISSLGFSFNSTTRKYETRLFLPFSGLQNGNYVVAARDTLLDVAGNALDGNFDGIPGGNFSRAFSVVLPVPVGSEFRVNFNTANEQRVPAVAREDNGDFVVVWQSDGQDGSFYGIYGRRYSAAGVAQPEFRANAITTNQQRFPAVAMDADGDFVVAWHGFGAGDTDGVFARRYNSNGIAQGIEFRVNTYTTSFQEFPAVAMDAAGNFVIAWHSGGQQGPNDFGDIYAQRYNAAGVAQGGEFHVNTTTTFEQYFPAVAMDSDGDFVIAWQGGEAGLDYDIFAQRYNAAGIAQGGEFLVNSNTNGDQSRPTVAMSASGDFVVAWADNSDIVAKRFNAAGLAQGGQFTVDNSDLSGSPSIALDDDGDFVVTWNNTPDLGDFDTYARRYNGTGVAQGGRFLVNTFTTGVQGKPAVDIDADGDFVIAWQSKDQDGSDYGIYAQRFARLTEVNVSAFLFQTAPHRLQFTFNDNVSAGLGTDDILLENLTTMQTVPSSDLSLSYDPGTNTATFSYTGSASGISGVLSDGNYRATLIASGITNPGGAPLAANHVFNFFFLNGDANHDARVNLIDFNILAANFGQSPRDFTQGDFNYDMVVNLADFNILAGRFGVVVGPDSFRGLQVVPDDRPRVELDELL